MSYLVLARKWRPRTFAEIVGQEHVVRALTNALDSDWLHHAYLFTGTRGVGKTTIARVLAKALNCVHGPTAEPCGECGACLEIDDGRFVDLIEVDAASKTKVDDTRDLLENVPFLPTSGRFKIYLIDEVHMLSKHSFNALLKTLEEPPPHVKFLLATTDPQKLPVTVLSRCLQFNLMRLTLREIRDRLEFICEKEGVSAETGALSLVARAADGSMRDALSLLDQAIAFCGGDVEQASVADMLGSIDRQYVQQLLMLLAKGDAAGLMAAVSEIDRQFPDYGRLLDDMSRLLQRIAVFQAVGRNEHDEELPVDELAALADQFTAEDLQLFYQIAIVGRRDLGLAPDPRSGIEMTLLRMLSFQPPGVDSKAPPKTRAKPDAKPDADAVEAAPPAAEPEVVGAAIWGATEWSGLVDVLDLPGASKLLASNCALVGRDGDEVRLALDQSAESFLTRSRQKALEEALSGHFGEALRVQISIGGGEGETPMQQKARHEDEALQAARENLESDPNVKALKDMFGATLNGDSVQIIDKS